ncbi:uncharacterized protein LOC126941155 isoform X2 [Macaca thibetana thibetana]|uniref:uncharacterized protein LOC126941155 isoform X2 n=1 Tax=Macaca thibetana thibetana TaxID=257877 RepID=UPI0021BC4D4F|nr:uncharacterized protein LOC126941155 isoform X2 [Macaca thibetana thibetana]
MISSQVRWMLISQPFRFPARLTSENRVIAYIIPRACSENIIQLLEGFIHHGVWQMAWRAWHFKFILTENIEVLGGLEYSGMIWAHCNLGLPGSSNSPAPGSPVAGITARTSRTMLNRNGENMLPCLVPDFREKVFHFLPLSIMLAVGFV